jgi:hypothetical protein
LIAVSSCSERVRIFEDRLSADAEKLAGLLGEEVLGPAWSAVPLSPSMLIVFLGPSYQKNFLPFFFTIEMPPFLTFAELPYVRIFLTEKIVFPDFAYSIVKPLIMIPGQLRGIVVAREHEKSAYYFATMLVRML